MSVDGLLIGVRTTPGLDDALRQALAPLSVDEEAPANYSLLPADDAHGFHFLYRGGCTAVRTRDRDRLLRGLARHLAGHRPPEAGIIRTNAVALVRAGGDAVLLPDVRANLPHVEGGLRASGSALLDDPWTDIDPVAGELVVPEHAESPIAPSALAVVRVSLPAGRAEPVVAPGRYPLAGWLFSAPVDDDGRALGRAEAVHRAYSSISVRNEGFHGGVVLRLLGALFAQVEAVTVSLQPAKLRDAVTARRSRRQVR